VNNINIRPIKPDDNGAIAIIIRSALKSFNANKPGTAYYDTDLDDLYTVFRPKDSAYWVAEKEEKILGGAGIYPTN
jgi:putative acetyltransferase